MSSQEAAGRYCSDPPPGVSLHEFHHAYRATYRDEDGYREKSFSINKYGAEEALRLAMEARQAYTRGTVLVTSVRTGKVTAYESFTAVARAHGTNRNTVSIMANKGPKWEHYVRTLGVTVLRVE
ncbi:unnamed protein product [Vitrella brassicaformis CCMP3155]|uniref:AP2/ERF domain-containing protein n=2 Tax=Vitrella brassicaformis TaxID=1169539 RepID=A0A0G4FQS1_VITBC|nr:unnamed protein product [Vitrella brassicaformis CCMP3155]|eukprot:CEM16565.1 unnamed protein product [Vitrella brassicaformis CCMP3155]